MPGGADEYAADVSSVFQNDKLWISKYDSPWVNVLGTMTILPESSLQRIVIKFVFIYSVCVCRLGSINKTFRALKRESSP
jgi:hypothetical protein